MNRVTVKNITGFRNRLQKLKQTTNDELALAIAEYGRDLAQSLYSGDSVIVTAESTGNGKARITTEGKQVAFLEYGIGTSGEGSYEGKLPNQPITFINRRKQPQTVDEWLYNYYQKTIDKDAKPVEGFTAKAQMWHTAEDIRQGGAEKAVKQYLDEKDV